MRGNCGFKRVACLTGTALALTANAYVPRQIEEPESWTVDFTKTIGTIRRLNGVCNATPLAGARAKSLNDLVLKLEIPSFRFHDASLENPGIELVDICRVFPLFHADPNDPRNYDFRATDDYLRQVVAAGAEIEFRLGESIEHSKNQYFVNPPPDYAKWAEICVHVIRHYNEGWANGYKWNIRRWSIWEEPDNPHLLTGAKNPLVEVYLPLYKATVTRIKREFPNLLVGGPECSNSGNTKPFIEYCAKEKLPIDFLGFSCYVRNPKQVVSMVHDVRQMLDANGFGKTEVSIAEWHLGPIGWGGHGTVGNPRLAKAWYDDLTGCLSGAYTAAVLMQMQNEPIDRMYYYAMKSGCFGLFDASGCPLPSYWAMYAFAQLAKGDERVAAKLQPAPGWWVLASKETKTGVGRILIASLRTDDWPIVSLKGDDVPTSVRVLDPANDFETTTDWKWDPEKKQLRISRNFGDSTVWLVETRHVF